MLTIQYCNKNKTLFWIRSDVTHYFIWKIVNPIIIDKKNTTISKTKYLEGVMKCEMNLIMVSWIMKARPGRYHLLIIQGSREEVNSTMARFLITIVSYRTGEAVSAVCHSLLLILLALLPSCSSSLLPPSLRPFIYISSQARVFFLE